jgi:hypothetical protein
MTALFARAGIDYRQWKAMTLTLLRSDFRLPGQSNQHYSMRTVSGLLFMAVLYGFFGLSMAALILLNPDALLTATITLTYLAFLVVTSVLTQYGSTIVATTDYAILAPRPVSSRTFLAIRFTNVFFHVAVVTTLMGYPAIAAFTLGHGVSIARGIAALVALYAWALAITLLLVLGYTTILRIASADRIQRVLGYAQMAMGLVAYGGFFLVMNRVGGAILTNAAMPREPWLVLLPPAWYASYIAIGTGDAGALMWMLGALSIVFIAAMVAALRGQLGDAYGERLGALAAAAPTPAVSSRGRERARGGPFFIRDEARAVALLVQAHFRYDTRVRLGVLGIVPMTLIYLFIGAGRGGSGDPFLAGEGAQGFDFIAMAVLMFPTMVTQQFAGSDAHRASWIYFAAPADRGGLIVALKDIITAFFMVPYVVFLALLFAWQFGNVTHAVIHAVCLGLVSHLVLQLALLAAPRLPFASEPQKSMGGVLAMTMMIASIVGGTAVIFWLKRSIYGDWTRVTLFIVLMGAITWGMNHALRGRASRAHRVPM